MYRYCVYVGNLSWNFNGVQKYAIYIAISFVTLTLVVHIIKNYSQPDREKFNFVNILSALPDQTQPFSRVIPIIVML